MLFFVGLAVGFILGVVGHAMPRPGKIILTIPPEVDERIKKLQRLGENSLRVTFANALGLYEYAQQAKLRDAGIWVHEVDGEQREIEVQ